MRATRKSMLNARKQRRNKPAEVKLWGLLRRSPGGVLSAQHPIGPYVADFYCAHQSW